MICWQKSKAEFIPSGAGIPLRKIKSKKRNRTVLMTKGGHPEPAKDAPNRGQSRMSRADMTADLEGFLQKLRTDCIDIYFLSSG